MQLGGYLEVQVHFTYLGKPSKFKSASTLISTQEVTKKKHQFNSATWCFCLTPELSEQQILLYLQWSLPCSCQLSCIHRVTHSIYQSNAHVASARVTHLFICYICPFSSPTSVITKKKRGLPSSTWRQLYPLWIAWGFFSILGFFTS